MRELYSEYGCERVKTDPEGEERLFRLIEGMHLLFVRSVITM